jgi:hypothetical protein
MGLFAQLLCCLMLLTSAAIAAPGAILEWNANTEPGVAGYKLYYGTSSTAYTKTVDAGDATVVALPELVAGFTYYFAVTAYNSAGIESLTSTEISFTIPWPAGLQLTYLPRLPIHSDLIPVLECIPVVGPPTGGFSFMASGAEQTAVTVYASNDLQTWEVKGCITNPTGRLMIQDLNSAGSDRRFYKLKQTALDPVVD